MKAKSSKYFLSKINSLKDSKKWRDVFLGIVNLSQESLDCDIPYSEHRTDSHLLRHNLIKRSSLLKKKGIVAVGFSRSYGCLDGPPFPVQVTYILLDGSSVGRFWAYVTTDEDQVIAAYYVNKK